MAYQLERTRLIFELSKIGQDDLRTIKPCQSVNLQFSYASGKGFASNAQHCCHCLALDRQPQLQALALRSNYAVLFQNHQQIE